ncbi:YopX family protein [Bacillus sonorensis]|uniref:YopX family protein n=1 Tax=Bacillus sonorensis TaxID=119858 RepID=UPI00227E8CD3|nr:YopX family protein [Bacillus sonorensis]MCY7858809.1 YopX family protein [Bacillus sonorensis]
MTHLHYRVWDGEQMYYSGDEGLCLSIGEMMPNKVFGWSLWLDGYGVIAHSGDEKHILMWGTGVKDKNSRLIYDRDVYHQGDLNILHVVEFKGGSFAGKQISSSSYTGLEYWKDRIEVIGDVYRNPDLLEAAE